MPYGLLDGIRVLEVSLLAPASVGGHLADMGAEVIKVEEPPAGDYMRRIGPVAMGSANGPSLMHLQWNRGKKSVALNLKTPEGRSTFLELVTHAQVVIEGLRAGTLQRWGLGAETIRAANPAIVFCSLSGFGNNSPYSRLAVHGQFFDAYAGYAPPEGREDGSVRLNRERAAHAGLNASGLWAAMAVAAALVSTLRTGRGVSLEVAEADVSVFWNWQNLEAALNASKLFQRDSYPPPPNARKVSSFQPGYQQEAVRANYYETKDGKYFFLQATEAKFWDNFLRGVGREDLKQKYPAAHTYDHQIGVEGLRQELIAIFKTKTQAEWLAFNLENDVAGGPVNAVEEVAGDPHFQARQHTYVVDQPEVGALTKLSTPVKIAGDVFTAGPAPSVGEHTQAVLKEILGYSDGRIAALRDARVIAAADDAAVGNAG